MKNPANAIKDTMWYFLMDKGQKENIPALKEAVYRLIQMTTQKTAGQRATKKTDINWDSLDMELMRIVIEATCLVLSGRLDELEEKPAGDTAAVVRCKDCMHNQNCRFHDVLPEVYGKYSMAVYMGDNSFCSLGEREEHDIS